MATDNVVMIATGATPNATPNESLVNMLEGLLAHAKSGYLRSMIGTGFTADGLRLNAWADAHPNVHEMLGSIAWLQHEYVQRHTE